MDTKGQGSLEYLMLIAAAVVVVAIVISFIASSIAPVEKAGNQQKYDYICRTLNTQNFECGCYLCDATRKGLNEASGLIETPNITNCNALSDYLDEPLLGACTAFTN